MATNRRDVRLPIDDDQSSHTTAINSQILPPPSGDSQEQNNKRQHSAQLTNINDLTNEEEEQKQQSKRTNKNNNGLKQNKDDNDDNLRPIKPHANSEYYTLFNHHLMQQRHLNNANSYQRQSQLPLYNGTYNDNNSMHFGNLTPLPQQEQQQQMIPMYDSRSGRISRRQYRESSTSKAISLFSSSWFLSFIGVVLAMTFTNSFKWIWKYYVKPLVKMIDQSRKKSKNNNNNNHVKNNKSEIDKQDETNAASEKPNAENDATSTATATVDTNTASVITEIRNEIAQLRNMLKNRNEEELLSNDSNRKNYLTSSTVRSHNRFEEDILLDDVEKMKQKLKRLQDKLEHLQDSNHQLKYSLSNQHHGSNGHRDDTENLRLELAQIKGMLMGMSQSPSIVRTVSHIDPSPYYPHSQQIPTQQHQMNQPQRSTENTSHQMRENDSGQSLRRALATQANSLSTTPLKPAEATTSETHNVETQGYSSSYYNKTYDNDSDTDSLDIGQRINPFQDDTQTLMGGMYGSYMSSIGHNNDNNNISTPVSDYPKQNIQTVIVEPKSDLSSKPVDSTTNQQSSADPSVSTPVRAATEEDEFDYGMFDGTVPSFDDLFSTASSVVKNNGEHPWMKDVFKDSTATSNTEETTTTTATTTAETKAENIQYEQEPYQELDSAQRYQVVQPEEQGMEELASLIRQTEQSTPKFQNSKLFKLFEKIGSGDVAVDENKLVVNKDKKKKKAKATFGKKKKTVSTRKKQVDADNTVASVHVAQEETSSTITLSTSEALDENSSPLGNNTDNEVGVDITNEEPADVTATTSNNLSEAESTNIYDSFDTYNFDNDTRFQQLLQFTEGKGTLDNVDQGSRDYALLKLKAKYYTKHHGSASSAFDFSEYCALRGIQNPKLTDNASGSDSSDSHPITEDDFVKQEEQKEQVLPHSPTSNQIEMEPAASSVQESQKQEGNGDPIADQPKYPDRYMTTLTNLTQGIMPPDVKIIETKVNPNVKPTPSKMQKKVKPWEKKKAKANSDGKTAENMSDTATTTTSIDAVVSDNQVSPNTEQVETTNNTNANSSALDGPTNLAETEPPKAE